MCSSERTKNNIPEESVMRLMLLSTKVNFCQKSIVLTLDERFFTFIWDNVACDASLVDGFTVD